MNDKPLDTLANNPDPTLGEPRNGGKLSIAQAAKGKSLKSMAVIGSMWMVLSMLVNRFMQLGSNLLLTRLLEPEMFGLMRMAGVATQGIAMFSDIGLGPSLIRSKRGDDPRFQDTLWTVQIIRGGLLWLGTCALAYPMALYFDEMLLIAILPVIGTTAFISGFRSTSIFSLQRHMQVGKLEAANMCAKLAGVSMMITWALIDARVWALVANGIVSSLTIMLLSHTWLGDRRNRFCWDKDALKELTGFGRWVMFSTIITFFLMNADTMVIGKMFGSELLGIYSVAIMACTIIESTIRRLCVRVVMPALSKIHNDNMSRLREVYYRVRLRTDLMGLTLSGALIFTGPVLIQALYDPRYLPAGWMFQIISIRVIFTMIKAPAQQLMLAMGNARITFTQNLVRAITLLVTLPYAIYQQDMFLVLLSISLCEIPGVLTYWYVQAKHGLLDLKREALAAGLIGLGLAAGYLVHLALVLWWAGYAFS